MRTHKKTNVDQMSSHKPNGELAPGHKLGNRFKPGESGNLAGRPAGSRNVTTILRELLDKLAPGEVVNEKFVKEFCKGKKQITNGDAVAARIFKAAIIDGESWAVKELIDRLEGKAKLSIDIDMAVADWRMMADQAGITEEDVINEAKLLIEQSDID